MAAAGPEAALSFIAAAGATVWRLDWQAGRCAASPLPEQPVLHDVCALARLEGGLIAVDSDVERRQTWLVELAGGRRTLVASGRNTFAAACSPGLTTIALGEHGPISLLAWPSRGHLGQLAGHSDGARDMCFSTDGLSLVTVGGESEDEQHRDAACVWDVRSLVQRRRWLHHHLGAVAVHPAGRICACGCMMPAAIRLWDIERDDVSDAPIAGLPAVRVLAFSSDGRYLCAGDGEGSVTLIAVDGYTC